MKRGDYINATLVGGENGKPRSGIYIGPRRAGQIEVHGEQDDYICLEEGAVVVPDENLFPDALAFVQDWRAENL